ncbi:MAG: BamA/TamA family outer membrane protein, partial [Bacteroidetes bacterium]|nr:BamA/TamA family outer membrane protein [Bacteroidota bacterium]
KKIENKNHIRISKGKKPKTSERQLFGEWLLNVSEPPVVYDSLLTKKSAKQIKLFLNNKGFFISSVSDSVVFRNRKKRASVYYIIKASDPYRINHVDYKIPDDLLKYYITSDTSNCLLKPGNNYDVDMMQLERERISTELSNNGYYLFTKDYVYYEIDSTIENNRVNITLGIKNFAYKYSDYSDSILEKPHQRFYISNIYIQPDFVSKKMDNVKKDTLKIEDYYILHTESLKFKTKVLLNSVFIRKGELYQLQNVEDTYKRISELKSFKTINIFFTRADGDYLDCHIQLSPIDKQSITIESEGTNTGNGNLGISGSIIYQNRNLFKGAEVLELRLKGGIEAQRTANSNTANISPSSQFNTVEIGPEANVFFPRFLVPFNVKASKRSNPKTIFTASINYQQRPDYTRYITNLAFSYTWKETPKKRHTISPFVINMVKVALQNNFLENINDLYLINSFTNHMATSTRYTFTFNEQNIKKEENFSFFRLNAESSGNVLRGLYNTINTIKPNTFIKDDKGRYTLFDVVYSQYLRIDADYRYYFNSNEINKVVFRFAAGIGKPLINFTSLPFERSFYCGGANGIRAWQSRSLGPGSFDDGENISFGQVGDGQIEGNIEYRFKLFKMLKGAFFADAGNMWLQKKDASRPGGDFQYDRFYKEIAIGSGVGLRADFSFFIIRFDIGLKVRDPKFSESKRWVIQNLFDAEWKRNYRIDNSNRKYDFLTFNLGIGYPF